jgi:polyisoprenyl-teichoic acid--peptidoglycan teichoic acid transferase
LILGVVNLGKKKNKNKKNNVKPKQQIEEQPKQKNLVLKFISIVAIIVGSFAIISGVVIFGFVGVRLNSGEQIIDEKGNVIKERPSLEFIVPPIKTTFLIMGIDYGDMLSDTNMVVHFNTERKTVDLISIPRDTKITLTNEQRDEIRLTGSKITPNIMKLTELHNYAGTKNGAKYMQQEIEKMLGINIDYYGRISTKIFADLVDAVGGVEMEIRPQGLYYVDPTQNLYINVPGGLQHLDGKQAEGVVRFRSYPEGDIERIRVQQEFMGLLLDQALSKENILSNVPSLISLFIESIDTNFTIKDSGKYLPYISDVVNYNINSYIMPITYEDPYVINDEIETREMVKDIFYNTKKTPDVKKIQRNDSAKIFNSKSLNIQVLNGGNIDGYATKVKNELQAEGYNIIGVDTYSGTDKVQTRIITNDMMRGWDLIHYFDNAYVQLDSTLTGEYDIVIIVGAKEKKLK